MVTDMTKDLNEKPNGKDLAVYKPKAIRAMGRSESTSPVSFVTEAEVHRLADTARGMRDG